MFQFAEEEDQVEDDSFEEEVMKLSRTKNADRRWKATMPNIYGMSVPDFRAQPQKYVPDDCETPYDFFCLFVDNEFVDKITASSKLYAGKKNRPGEAAKITHDSMRCSHAIMFLTGYLTPASCRMYWELREDTMNPLVRKAMPRDDFIQVVANTHFVDTEEPDPKDRFWKVRPLFTEVNSKSKQYITQTENVSIDEGMVKYFGPHPLKQFIRGKPTRYGYKIWILATNDGRLLHCQPYGGASTAIKQYGLGQGPDVVLGLSEQFGLVQGTRVFVDNLFTSMDLLEHMGDRGLGVTGTVRLNRLHGIPLPPKKEAQKMNRGEYQATYTQDMAVIVWKDSVPVYMCSNCTDILPECQCRRYSSKEGKYVNVTQPCIIDTYNKNMGGVDVLDASVKCYAITTRVRKWYFCLYTWFLNVSMVQAWRTYQEQMKIRSRLQIEKEAQEKQDREDQEERDKVDQERRDQERRDQGDQERRPGQSQSRMREEKKKAEKRAAAVKRKREEEHQAAKLRRVEEKKKEEISLLEFTRQVVELMLVKHGKGSEISTTARLSSASQEVIRFDNIGHLIILSDPIVSGVCQHCKGRARYRCKKCSVALHPQCFHDYHVNS